MIGTAIVKDGSIKCIEFDESLDFKYEDGKYVVDLQIYNKIINPQLTATCFFSNCDKRFPIKSSKQNIKYCPDHRRKKKNV
jgi:hypothetical protein